LRAPSAGLFFARVNGQPKPCGVHRDQTGWLRWSDSNSEMSSQNIPLKGRTDFPGSSRNSRHRDYSRLSCRVCACLSAPAQSSLICITFTELRLIYAARRNDSRDHSRNDRVIPGSVRQRTNLRIPAVCVRGAVGPSHDACGDPPANRLRSAPGSVLASPSFMPCLRRRLRRSARLSLVAMATMRDPTP
jgi:hypothetical protein